jgi:Carboxypeptidase regulatory-like domain
MLRRLLLACAVVGSPLLAQNAPPIKPAHLQGQVVDTAGRPIRSAIVETDDPPKAVVSDDSGFFRFADLPAGPITVRVRRIGFEGVEFQLRLPSDSTVSIGVKLLPVAQLLEAVQIDAGAEAAHPQLALTGFYQRLRAGWGHMVTPEEIDKRRKLAPSASSFLQDIVGVTVKHAQVGVGRGRAGRSGGGGGAAILGKTPYGGDCVMNLLMNGQPVKLQDGETFDMYFSVNELYAIETYAHAAEIPTEYHQLLGNDFCGAVVVWTISRMILKPQH